MFGKIIKASDLSFLENDSFRNMFKEEIVKIIKLLVDSPKIGTIDDGSLIIENNTPFDNIYINYDVHKRLYALSIKLDYKCLKLDVKHYVDKALERMCIILKNMDLIFQICSNSEGINIEREHDYSLCTFSKTEHRKMFNTGLRLPAIKKKEIFVESQMHTHIALLIYNMFGDIANELVKFNNGNSVKIFYGDIDFAFKDWVDS